MRRLLNRMTLKHIDIDKIKEYRQKGYTLLDISKKVNIPFPTVEYLCKLNNIKCVTKEKDRKRCVICSRYAKRKEMFSNNKGLFCKECWEKRKEGVTYSTVGSN